MAGDLFSLAGQIAAVTGANTGLGQAMALALAEAGADIVAIGRSTPDETRVSVEATGRRFHFINAELADDVDCEAIAARAEAALGGVTILLNNAGTIRRANAVDFTEADWDEVVGVNLKTTFFLSQAFGKRMIARGRGKIINIASMLSFQGGIRVVSYTASKSGVLGLTRALANEWAGQGVNVNAIAPGYMETNNTAALRADATRNRDILARIPAGRWGEPSDLAGAVVFLASSAADYVHGAVIPVDGGWLAR
ncbi:MAG TPA: 2-dehydro-3-deoxy-D-gluconate 5-dehydrogenase KduD [Caulobacterales bacterium]|nr:2-dehydro-3-deoxy-D-gluconate 5-dehydrogenase KduD [Caulobacterales bacterium]